MANPTFPQSFKTGQVSVNAANTASDGSGTTFTVFTAGANGSLLQSISIVNAQASYAASSAMVARIFIRTGATLRLIKEIVMPAVTRAAAVIGAAQIYTFPGAGLPLQNGQTLEVCQSVYAGVQDLTHYTAVGGDY